MSRGEVMVELRWRLAVKGRDEKADSVLVAGARPQVSGTWMFILQYRAKDNWGGHNDEPDWGDWQDVPFTMVS